MNLHIIQNSFCHKWAQSKKQVNIPTMSKWAQEKKQANLSTENASPATPSTSSDDIADEHWNFSQSAHKDSFEVKYTFTLNTLY